jgi:hypothetical protein
MMLGYNRMYAQKEKVGREILVWYSAQGEQELIVRIYCWVAMLKHKSNWVPKEEGTTEVSLGRYAAMQREGAMAVPCRLRRETP